MKRIFKTFLLSSALLVVPTGRAALFSGALDDCPKLLITCPAELREAGKTYLVKVRVNGADPTKKLSYKWRVSSGQIVSGQGTPTLRVRVTKPWESLTATVEVGGLPDGCGNIASCSFVVS